MVSDDAQDFPETTEGSGGYSRFQRCGKDEMECHEDVPVRATKTELLKTHGYQITLELEKQNTRELSEDSRIGE